MFRASSGSILLWLGLSLWSVFFLGTVATAAASVQEEPMIVYETTGSSDQVIAAVRESVRAHGLELLREEVQTFGDATFHTLYFCNFGILSAVLLSDPRSGAGLPCQVTIGMDGERVVLSSRNPAFVEFAGPSPAHANCHGTRDLLVSVLEAAVQ
jgi:uncharacterized protein (DUF302 family)